jgi:V8-like Glu-specific endopeptidase
MPRRTIAILGGALIACGALALADCGDASSGGNAAASSVRGYWTHQRLVRTHGLGVPGVSHVTQGGAEAARVGALFQHDPNGDHFCTASVVDSPGQDLIVTAAHCVNAGTGSGNNSDVVFIPAYRDGDAPYGVWLPKTIIVDPRWAATGDPDLDVAFIALQSDDGTNIESVLGANRLGIDQGFDHMVRITGYPTSGQEPISCANHTAEQSQNQMRVDCTGYTGGTSGSPWIADFNPITRSGVVVGVIGGYQQGGDTPDVSYSPYFDAAVQRLYQQAVAAE